MFAITYADIMKNSEKGIFDLGEWRDLPMRTKEFARGGGKIRPRAKENEQTGENKLNKRGKEGMDSWKDYDITTRSKKHNGVVKKVLLARREICATNLYYARAYRRQTNNGIKTRKHVF